METEQGYKSKVQYQDIIYNKIHKPFFTKKDNSNENNFLKLEPKIENKRHKSAGNTRIVYNQPEMDYYNKNNNLNYIDDDKLYYGKKIGFNNINKLNCNPTNNLNSQNYPIINFEINNNVYNPERNYNKDLPIENAILIKKNNENKNKHLQLEVPEAKNYIMTSTDLVNYGTKTNKSKPITDLKNIFANANSQANNNIRSGSKQDSNNLNTLESITRKFMFSCENNFQEYKPQTVFNSINNKGSEENDIIENRFSPKNFNESKLKIFLFIFKEL